jgi:DNA-binding XRE family transcriptional regulator
VLQYKNKIARNKKVKYTLGLGTTTPTLEEPHMKGRTELGRRVRKRRRDLDITQAQLAEASGVQQSHISAIERGRAFDLRAETLWRLARSLGCSMDDLMEQPEWRETPKHRPVLATAAVD